MFDVDFILTKIAYQTVLNSDSRYI